MNFRFLLSVPVLGLALAAAASGKPLSPDVLARLPAAKPGKVDFVRDIQPIFLASCTQCHGHGKSKGSFNLETRADFLEGGDNGVAAVPGKSAESPVLAMIAGLDPDMVMPKKGKRLTAEQVAVFRAWIDQGMAWPENVAFHIPERANLQAKAVTLPPAKPGLENPVDRALDRYLAAKGRSWPQAVDDRTFARRAWLDAIGLLPKPEELAAFLADPAPDKRSRLVARLLADDQRYAEHWLSFWNDLLRNDYKGTGYIDGGRKPLTPWLYTALARNVPYHQFVRELVDPGAESEGFTRGILWRGAVNASMVPPMQAAQSVAQVILGVNLKCASCHDSFIDDYTLEDAYGIATIYADSPLEIAECDKPTGHVARVKFLYNELGAIDVEANAAERKRRLADIITGRTNGRMPRTVVNRYWQRFFGHGLVEPVDEMDRPAWAPEVIDVLAEDFVAHGHDLKHLIARILTSRAYQLPATETAGDAPYVFQGPTVRRLSAEQFADAVRQVTGLNYGKPDAKLNRRAAFGGEVHATLPLAPKWIWIAPGAARKAAPATVLFRRTLELATLPTEAVVTLAADDNWNLRVNGKNLGSSARRLSTSAVAVDVLAALKVGANTIEVSAANLAPDEGRLVSAGDARLDPDSPAGLIVYGRVRAGTQVLDFVSDARWTAQIGVDPQPLSELGGLDLAPWRLGQPFLDLAAAPADTLPVERASLVAADPLMAALGRPNREQVTTVRQSEATTLQALELTNGSTLAALLARGAKEWLAKLPPEQGAEAVARTLYLRTLGREPNARELDLARQVLGTPVRADGVEDLLWALTMLPEFQLIH